MAQAYTIYIRDYRGTGNKERSTATTPLGESVGGNTERKSDEGKLNGGKIALAAYHYAKRGVEMAASYSVSMIETRTGNAKLAQNVSFGYNLLTKTINIGESIAMGFFTTGGNPVGALVGAAVGVGMQAAQIGMGYEKQAVQQSIESVTLAQNAIRIGASGNRTGATK